MFEISSITHPKEVWNKPDLNAQASTHCTWFSKYPTTLPGSEEGYRSSAVWIVILSMPHSVWMSWYFKTLLYVYMHQTLSYISFKLRIASSLDARWVPTTLLYSATHPQRMSRKLGTHSCFTLQTTTFFEKKHEVQSRGFHLLSSLVRQTLDGQRLDVGKHGVSSGPWSKQSGFLRAWLKDSYRNMSGRSNLL